MAGIDGSCRAGLEAAHFVYSRMERWVGQCVWEREEGVRRYLFRSFAHCLTGLLVSLLLRFKSSFCILDTSPLSAMCFANIFSQPVTYLFNLLIYVFIPHGDWEKLA